MEKTAFLNDVNKQLAALATRASLASWNLSTTGKKEYAEESEKAEMEVRLFLSDKQRFESVKALLAGNDLTALERRQLEILRNNMVENQLDRETLQQLVNKQIALQEIITTFRGTIDGKEVNNKQIEEILRDSTDNELRKKAWIASKQVGTALEPGLIDLIKLRNDSAAKLGYVNYYEMEVALQEFDSQWLAQTLQTYRDQTDVLFRRVKDSIDQAVGKRLGIDPAKLMPWHMSDMFFQEAPQVVNIDLATLYEGRGDHVIEELGTRTYDSIGLDIRDIIARSDLYERPSKDQHAFTVHIDGKQDVRVLANLRPNETEMETMLHEMGHSVYFKYLDAGLPFMTHTAAHIFVTEAVAMFFGRFARDAGWYQQIMGISGEQLETLKRDLPLVMRNQMLVSTRWETHFAQFERELYRTEKGDSGLWYKGVRDIQYLNVPEDRLDQPDWAAKYHFSMAPVYYHNYLLGEMLASQFDHALRAQGNGHVLTRQGGQWFVDRVFKPGASLPWNTMIEQATGEKLNPSYLVKQFNY